MTPAPTAIVVLGSGFRTDKTLPPNDRLSANGIVRLTEAIRLASLLPSARLIVSDGVGQGESLAQTAMILGVPRERITLEARSNDTSDEAALLPPLVGKEPFLLVTSAAHMRRALALCRRQGLNPIAAATDFTRASVEWTAGDLVPRAAGLPARGLRASRVDRLLVGGAARLDLSAARARTVSSQTPAPRRRRGRPLPAC